MKNELDLGTSLDQVTKWAPVTHLTLTGYHAGHPICDSPRNETDQYLHAAYAPIAELRRNEIPTYSPLCSQCLLIWDDPAGFPKLRTE